MNITQARNIAKASNGILFIDELTMLKASSKHAACDRSEGLVKINF